MKKIPGIEFLGVCAASGLHARYVGGRFGFRQCTTDETEILKNPAINTVAIATRHHLHARQVIAALNAGKHVFVEKPLCINEEQLNQIVETYSEIQNSKSEIPLLMVGYNRRFAPMAVNLKAFLSEICEPLVMNYRINAGYVEPEHWVQDPEQGGGRIIGEICHFVESLTFLSGSLPIRVSARGLDNEDRYRGDNIVITLEFGNGSLGTIAYVASGDRSFSKERLEVFGGGASAALDDFRRMELYRKGQKKVFKSFLRQDKGHRNEWKVFVSALQNGGPMPIPFEELISTTLTTFRIVDSLRSGEQIEVDTKGFIQEALTSTSVS